MSAAGAELFAHDAYPPNALGYCGPDEAAPLLRRDAGAGAAIAAHARQFEGAWVYLELIAAAAGLDDPLDERVVEAYWLGNDLLDSLDPDHLEGLLRERLPEQRGASWAPGFAHHGYHVFAVYPWVGLLARTGRTSPTLDVLDNCRIRWGEVVAVEGAVVWALVAPLVLLDGRLALGDVVEQAGAVSRGGVSLLEPAVQRVAVGNTVALHWGWVCDVLRPDQLEQLRERTTDQLGRTNAVLAAHVA
ncbi:MAG: DUF6390 family protein [Jatrophihabitans sp.]